MRRSEYKELLIIPEISPAETISLYTKNGHILVSQGYERVVIGGRGPYIELYNNQVILLSISIPPNQSWCLGKYWKDRVYYIEWRTRDDIMVYEQLKTVKYADYKIGCFYISPWDLTSEKYPDLIEGEKPEHHR